METEASIKNVRSFWNTEACGTHFIDVTGGNKDFFERFREFRYRTEWHIPVLVPFTEASGKNVLEIGTGNGADGVMFALNGARYTGVDLTDAALEATRKHFEVLGLTGTFQNENAEQLTFPDDTFDIVYSHGVLHHTPNTQVAINEIHRVLKPGGQAIVMLYHKNSFNYHVRMMLYMRLRVLLRVASRAGRWATDRRTLRSEGLAGIRGNADQKIWDIHYDNFLRRGWSYLKASNFVHHCSDGPECPVAYAFAKSEARELFSSFRDLRMAVAHFPLSKYPFAGKLPLGVEKALASRIGWYLFIFARK